MPENFVDLCREYVAQLEYNRELYEKALRGAITDNAEGMLLAGAAIAAKEELEAEVRRMLDDPFVPNEEKTAGSLLVVAYDKKHKKWKESLKNDPRSRT